MKLLQRIFRIWDYKNASLKRRILGLFPLVKKDNVLTLLVFGLPLIQRKRYVSVVANGGGGELLNKLSLAFHNHIHITDYAFRFCGIVCYGTRNYRKLANIVALKPNGLLQPTLANDPNILPKLAKLTAGMPKESKDLAYTIITREIQTSPSISYTKLCYTLTQQELTALETLAREFYAKILPLAPNLCYYNGYFLPESHLECSVFFYKHGLHTLRHLDRLRDKDIIDVGGYIGDSALIFQDYTQKSIHCFEASKSTYQKLLTTLRLNNTTRIIPINKALGAQEEKLMLNLYGGGSSLVFATHSLGSEEVEVITLDSYVQKHNIQVGFIKVDIEGFEMEFLKGAKHTICTQKPAMLISIYHQASDFFDIKPLIESWNLGYTFHLYKPLDGTISVETALFCEMP
ncbi:FkbM family methyltransferase [Helicobacter canis]|uniref:FkbM family methyltransferase n=1 Tax=Helicobacter canis TaxID=29419 RepID=UPI00294306EC|nr:FkbM family methyltransferase [Helicobacter canis]